ncbi:MAG: FxsA family protein [Pseudomonadota bacterium]|nr:FxsA family protein [Pseudomonadota bacterium]
MNLFQRLLLLFIIIPIFEIYLLITIGHLIGPLPTVALVILTAIAGTYLLRVQGLTTLQNMQTILAQGQLPTEALLEGILLLLGGALLLTPGFFTDAIGFSCLIPVIRRYWIAWLTHTVLARYVVTSEYQSSSQDSNTLEGEYRREEE